MFVLFCFVVLLVDGRKRTYPLSGPYVPPAYSTAEGELPRDCSLSTSGKILQATKRAHSMFD